MKDILRTQQHQLLSQECKWSWFWQDPLLRGLSTSACRPPNVSIPSTARGTHRALSPRTGAQTGTCHFSPGCSGWTSAVVQESMGSGNHCSLFLSFGSQVPSDPLPGVLPQCWEQNQWRHKEGLVQRANWQMTEVRSRAWARNIIWSDGGPLSSWQERPGHPHCGFVDVGWKVFCEKGRQPNPQDHCNYLQSFG